MLFGQFKGCRMLRFSKNNLFSFWPLITGQTLRVFSFNSERKSAFFLYACCDMSMQRFSFGLSNPFPINLYQHLNLVHIDDLLGFRMQSEGIEWRRESLC